MNNQYIYAISRRRNASDYISNILIDPELILNGVYVEGV
jgi:hypothetical protein